MPRILTALTLEAMGACTEQVALFRNICGEQVKVTVALCVKHAPDFNWNWVARRLLTASAMAGYEPIELAARVDYHRTITEAKAKTTVYIRSKYGGDVAADKAEYQRVKDEYERTVAAADTTYERTVAAAWARAYNADTE